MARLGKLITESKYLKREFGEPLPTFNGVMKQHQVNKLKEGWWEDMSAEQQAAYIKAHPKSQQAQQAGGDEPEGKKDAKGITRYTRKDAQGREYDAMTGKGKGKDSRNEPDDEEYFKSMMGGGEPEDKPFGGDTGKDADSEQPKAISDAAPAVQDAIGYIHTDTKDGQEFHDLMSQETLSTKDVIRSMALSGRSTHGAGPEGEKKMDNFAQSKIEVSDEEQKQNAPLGQKIAKATNGNPEDLKFVGVRAVKDKDGNTKTARSFYDKSDGMMMAADEDGNVYENGVQSSTGYKIKDSYDPQLGESLLKENPAVAAAAAMTTIRLMNQETGRKNKATTALYDKGNPSHKKAVGIFQKLKDKFKKSDFDKEKDKVAKGADAWVKNQDDPEKQKALARSMGISVGRTGKELGEDKMNESIKMHTISGNKRFMTKTAIPILRKYGIKNVRANTVGGYFLELRFQIDSGKLKELDKELKRKNKTAYGGIVENRKISIDRRNKMREEILRKIIREELKSIIKEDDKEAFSQPIPAQIDRFMKKFIGAMESKNLNRKRKLAILGRVIVALKLEPSEVSKYARLVKREL
jgi:hypothetical protein